MDQKLFHQRIKSERASAYTGSLPRFGALPASRSAAILGRFPDHSWQTGFCAAHPR